MLDAAERRASCAARALIAALLVAATVIGAACAGAPTAGRSGTTATSAAPFKVTVAGDSISIGLGAALRKITGEGVVVKVIGEEGTGLARPDSFDWPSRLDQLAREYPPAVLVLSLSSNDAQDLRDRNGNVTVKLKDPGAWDAEYSRRLAASIDPFAQTGTRVVFVAHVVPADPAVGGVNRRVLHLAEALATTRPFVQVSDLAQLLSTGEQRADRCLMPDGLHLTVPCLDEAAASLAPDLARR